MISPAVRREIDRILDNKYPGSAIVGFGSPGVLDEETWEVIGIGELSGKIQDPTLYDLTAGPGYNVYYEEDEFPVPIPLGHRIHADVMFFNTSDYHYDMKCTTEWIDPDGHSVGKYSATYPMDAHSAIFEGPSDTVLDKQGTWELHAILESV